MADAAARAAKPARERHAHKDQNDKPPGKAKPVRDGFTKPRADFALIARLKDRALGFRCPIRKGELLCAGLHVPAALGAWRR